MSGQTFMHLKTFYAFQWPFRDVLVGEVKSLRMD